MASRLLLAIVLLVGALAAQTVRGRVLDFDGKPARGVVLNLLDEHGEHLADVESAADGSYAFDEARAGSSVCVWLEGVALKLPAAATGVDFDFANSHYFTVRGHVVDPGGAPLADRDVDACDQADGRLATVKTDGKGAFAVRLNQPADHLRIDEEWRHAVAGPFAADQELTIDLRQAKNFFLLQGTLRDENARPVRGAEVVAQEETNAVARTRTDATGHWSLWCNRALTLLWFRAGDVLHRKPGAWRAAATLDLDWRGEGFVVLTGRVLDARGRPVAGAHVLALRERGIPGHPDDPIATTDGGGRFRALVPDWARFVGAYVGDDEVLAAGPWRTDAVVELHAVK